MIRKVLVTAAVVSAAGGISASRAQDGASVDWSGSYYCKLTASAGVKLNKVTERWESTLFNVADEANLVTVKATGETNKNFLNEEEPTYTITVKDFGDADDGFTCVSPYLPFERNQKLPMNAKGTARCRFIGWDYEFDFKNLKMQTMFRGGYMDAEEENPDTPYLAISKCDKIG